MDITVVVCTFNRCQSLEKALESIAASVLPESIEWEVLVVDNNSSDQTREIAERFCKRPDVCFRYVFEPKPGKSHALNRGIRDSRGTVLAFTDDDVTVTPGWLQILTSGLRDGEWAGSGGRIVLDRAFSPPQWLPRDQTYALAPLTVFDPHIEAGPLLETPFGANMAFQRRVFQEYGGFRTDLGPGLGHNIPQKSEDSEFGHRLLAAGERLRYEPAALIYHSLPQSRLQKSYFLSWWFDKARADVHAFGLSPGTRWSIAGIPLYLFRRLAVWTVRWLVAVEPHKRFSAKVRVWGKLGEIQECYRLAHAERAETESSVVPIHSKRPS